MEVTGSGHRLREAAEAARRANLTVGFIPTMGALHEGHARLVRVAQNECGYVAVSIFVNPLQFGVGEDLAGYPRTVDADVALVEDLGGDLLFTPEDSEMYPGGPPEVTVDPGPLGNRLEGLVRPGHFRGVLTVVVKLLNLVGPSRVYFGEKDAQQLALIRRLVRDLNIPVTVVGVATVREADGLARSSRNRYLSPEERLAAPVLFDALSEAAALARRGERSADVLRAVLARRIASESLARPDYAAVVDDVTWEDVTTIDRPSRALVAARVGRVRLIDNLLLPQRAGEPEPSPGPGAVQNTPEG